MVFSMFLSQLKGLEKPSSSQFKQCFALLEVSPHLVHAYRMYVRTNVHVCVHTHVRTFVESSLQSLATVKTFNLCLGMDGQDIIIDLFKTIFNIVK